MRLGIGRVQVGVIGFQRLAVQTVGGNFLEAGLPAETANAEVRAFKALVLNLSGHRFQPLLGLVKLRFRVEI